MTTENATTISSRQRFLNACNGKPNDRPPLWIMRQAGRYLPEYRELKKRYSFLELVKTPELATTVTLQPFARFKFDAAIIFSDILVIPEALGQPYHFKDEGGIQMDYTLEIQEDFDNLDPSCIQEKLSYVHDALTMTRKALKDDYALLGFGGAPWTLATYMVEGGSSKNFSKIKSLAYTSPPLFNSLMEKLTASLIDYFKMQVHAGVDAIQIFDSWAALAPISHYWDFSLKWIKLIIDAIPEVPIILFSKGMCHHPNLLASTGASVLGMDWTVNMSDIRNSQHTPLPLQGNMDPAILCADPQTVKTRATQILDEMAPHPGHIFNLGHGITPDAKIENVQTLIETVQNYRA